MNICRKNIFCFLRHRMTWLFERLLRIVSCILCNSHACPEPSDHRYTATTSPCLPNRECQIAKCKKRNINMWMLFSFIIDTSNSMRTNKQQQKRHDMTTTNKSRQNHMLFALTYLLRKGEKNKEIIHTFKKEFVRNYFT